MMEDQIAEDHPLSSTSDKDESLFTLDEYEDDEFDQVECDKSELLADVAQELEEDIEKKVAPPTSFYRPQEDGGGNSSMYFSTVYEEPPKDINSKIKVNDPRLITSSFFSGPSYWTYNICSSDTANVRRRFRYFVALENRIRKANPGLVLPVRPSKHLYIDEALGQTLSSAKARAVQLEIYLNELFDHPLLTNEQGSPLNIFLTFPQEDLGLIWSEVSSSVLTRFSLQASTSFKEASLQNNLPEEHNMEMRSLIAAEKQRLNLMQNSIPKILGYLQILKEYGSDCGGTGMELSKLSKDIRKLDPTVSSSFEMLAKALLKSSRRIKKQKDQACTSLKEFHNALLLKPCYEHAIQDRYQALYLLYVSQPEYKQKLRLDAQEVAQKLKSDFTRLAKERRRHWFQDVQVFAKLMKQNYSDQVTIWESARKKFEETN